MHLSTNGKVKAVLFDLDGVILDSMPSHVSAWREAFLETGLDVAESVFLRHEGNLEWNTLQPMMAPERPNMGQEDFQVLAERQRALYLERYGGRVTLFPGVPELVAGLSEAGVRLAVATSSTRRVLSGWLIDFLDKHFHSLVTRDRVRQGKPSPEPYLTALADLDVAKEQAVVVENAPAGIEAAKAAGIFCAALTTTLPPEMLSRADRIFGDHIELAAWLRDGGRG